MIQAAFNSFAGFDDGRDTPKTYKDVPKHKNQVIGVHEIPLTFTSTILYNTTIARKY
jgi:hypothetical protein